MAGSLHGELADVGVHEFTSSGYRPGPVCHVVLFRFAEGVTAEQREDVAEKFRALAESERDGRRYIESIEAGPQLSGEEGANSYHYGFIVRFASLGDRNYYVGAPVVTDPQHRDPNHDAFKREIGPLLDADGGAQVLDFCCGPTAEPTSAR